MASRGVHNIRSKEEWDELLASRKPFLVDWFATWCPPCKAIAPSLVNFSNNEGKGFRFVKVDVDELPQLTQEFGVRAMPTFMVFENGERTETLVGADLARLREMVQKTALKYPSQDNSETKLESPESEP